MSDQWFRVFTTVRSHPRFLKCGREAKGMWLDLMAYTTEHTLGGFVPREGLETFEGTMRRKIQLIDALIAAGLLVEDGDGWSLRNYAEKGNRTREQIEREAEANRERQDRHREKKRLEEASKNREGSKKTPPFSEESLPRESWPRAGRELAENAAAYARELAESRDLTQNKAFPDEFEESNALRNGVTNASVTRQSRVEKSRVDQRERGERASAPPPSEAQSGVHEVAPRSEPSPHPRTDLGGLEAETWAEGIKLATGKSCSPPRGSTDVGYLRDALRDHCPRELDAEARRVWLRDAARDYAEAKRGSTLTPKWFLERLNSPDSDRPRSGFAPTMQPLAAARPKPAFGLAEALAEGERQRRAGEI